MGIITLTQISIVKCELQTNQLVRIVNLKNTLPP